MIAKRYDNYRTRAIATKLRTLYGACTTPSTTPPQTLVLETYCSEDDVPARKTPTVKRPPKSGKILWTKVF